MKLTASKASRHCPLVCRSAAGGEVGRWEVESR
jgi:hypothetical protein